MKAYRPQPGGPIHLMLAARAQQPRPIASTALAPTAPIGRSALLQLLAEKIVRDWQAEQGQVEPQGEAEQNAGVSLPA